MSEVRERYAAWAKQLDDKIDRVPADAWANPSDNPGWTAKDVVLHVVTTSNNFLDRVGLRAVDDATASDDVVAAWKWTKAAMLSALDDATTSSTLVDGMGSPTRFDQLIDQYLVFDLVVHAFDLARAAGIDETLDLDSVRFVADRAPGIVDMGREMGAFGPAIDISDDANEQAKMLALLGRKPT